MIRVFTRLLPLVALALWLSSCGPTYFLTMKPSRSSGEWAHGREVARQQHDSLDVRLSFVRYEPNQLVFEAEFRNNSDSAVLISPAAFYFQPIATQPVASTTAMGLLPGRVPAVDPELRLAELDRRAEEETRKATRAGILQFATTVACIALDVSSIGRKETSSQFQARQTLSATLPVAFAAARIEHSMAADELSAEAGIMADQALRKTTLEPGFKVRGTVYFPRCDQADLLRLTMPVRQQPVIFDFSQQRSK
jgi:hypothetical protein